MNIKRMFRRKIFLILIMGIMAGVGSGCSFSGALNRSAPSAGDGRNPAYWLNRAHHVRVIAARRINHSVAVHFEIELDDGHGKEFYAYAEWDPEEFSEDYRGQSAPLQFLNAEEWQDLKLEEGEEIAFVSAMEWQSLREGLFSRIVPAGPGAAIRTTAGTRDLVAYRDERGELRAVPFQQRPDDIAISRRLTAEEFESEITRLLHEAARNPSFPGQHILIPSAGAGVQNQMFMYLDLEEDHVVALNSPFEMRRKKTIQKGLRTADYAFINSYVFGLAARPVSYAFRLFALSKDTVHETMTLPLSLLRPENVQVPPLNTGQSMDIEAFEQELNRLTGRRPSFGTVDMLIGGSEFFPRFLEAVRSAKQSIDIRIFIFDNDDYAVQVADLLRQKAAEGVRVRVLLDGMGQIMGQGKMPEGMPLDFVPPYSMQNYLMRDSRVQVRVRPNAWFRADHTKTIIIDQRICFTGGMNIGREYRYSWHDMMAEVRGEVLEKVVREFELSWAHAGMWGDAAYAMTKVFFRAPQIKGGEYPVRVLFTRVNDPEIYYAQLEAIRRARNRIWIHNPYLADNVILYELVAARRRGVDVRVILPESGNHHIMNRSNVMTANILFRNGVAVYFYPGMSHVKAALYDGWLCAGSANFDRLSLRDNLELNIATSAPAVVEEMRTRLFERDFLCSRLMREPLPGRLSDVVAEILAESL